MSVTKTEVLRLYKNLLLYSKSLKFTEVSYYKKRITSEFKKNKELEKPEDIVFAYKGGRGSAPFTETAYRVKYSKPIPKEINQDASTVWIKEKLYYKEVLLFKMFKSRNISLFGRYLNPFINKYAPKHTIDYTQVPKINECDLVENFVRGSGPGGSAVNKNSNCVVLTHAPTGIVVKCHTSRCQENNRKTAREILVSKLDDMLNGENSVAAQKKRLDEQKYKKTEYKKKKRAQLKEEWKKREGLF